MFRQLRLQTITRPLVNVRYFSRSLVRPNSQLKQILKNELASSQSIPNKLSEIHENFIQDSSFKINATPGKSLVEMVKSVNDQNISVVFDIDEITDLPIDSEIFEDQELDDLEIDNYLSTVKILVSKPDNSGIFLNLLFQGDSFMIDYINSTDNAVELKQNLLNGEFVDKVNYQGPRFSELDESLQLGFESWLNELGINDELANFIIGFSEIKEEDEYRKWLSDLSGFF